MLRVLHIKNFSIIEEVTIEFQDGFNVLTGETGSGKSIIIDALCLALGERAAADLVRSGESEAVVAAFFDDPASVLQPATAQFLRDYGINVDEGFILKRVVSAQGKSRAYLNGSMVNIQTLSDVSRCLIDVHGQYEHQSLLSSENQIDLLDAYGGLVPERKEVEEAYEVLNALRRESEELSRKERERAQRTDMLQYQINEIGAANLSEGEDEALAEELKILGSAARLAELAHEAYESLYAADSACISRLSLIRNALAEISGIDPRARETLSSFESALPLLDDTARFLRDYKDRLDFDPGRLGEVQERLELIKGLKRKYGAGIMDVLEFRERAVAELDELQHSGERLDQLKDRIEAARQSLTEKAGSLSKKRATVAGKIEPEVVSQLADLAMPDTKFTISMMQEKGDDTLDGFSATRRGIDSIEFLISPNIGENLRPLAKIASGGELSRIMLALKSIMAKGDDIPVLVFDEIDAGVGGRTAENVGRKLRDLSDGHQVLCITHLPQIASYAGRHLKIEKKVNKDRTVVEVNMIDKNERKAEVARMLSGEASDVSLKHAGEMLRKGKTR